MGTTKNSHKDPGSVASEEKLLLDALILILHHSEHMSSAYDDMFIYVHENPQGRNICKIDQAPSVRLTAKCLRQKHMTKIATIKGGKSCVC
jgi:hypothetical protein